MPTPVFRPVGRIKDSFENLLTSPRYEDFTSYWLEITVTDPQRPAHLVTKLKRRFPKALAILHETSRASLEEQHRSLRANRYRPAALAKDFFKQARVGKELTESETRLVEEIYEQVREES